MPAKPTIASRLAPLLIIAVGLWAYHAALHGPLIFDDVAAITNNPEIHSVASSLRPAGEYTNARPIPVITLAINYAIHNTRPFGYHVVNIAIHCLTAVTLFGLARRTLLLSPRFAGDATFLACSAGLLFVAHPLATEVVNFTLQRTESLMALFALLTLYCLNRALTSPGRSRAWLVTSVAACAIGMGCKQSIVVMPLVAIAYDRTFFSATFRSAWRARRGFYVALFSTIAILIYFQLARTHYDTIGLAAAHRVTPWVYLLTQCTVLPHYLRMVFWPRPLVIDYYDWPIATSLVQVWPSALFILVLLAITFGAFYRRTPGGFAALSAFLALAVTSTILPMPTEVAVERRMYLPLAFLLPFIATALWVFAGQLLSSSAVKLTGVAALLFAVVLMTRADIARSADYASTKSLWLATVTDRPGSARAWGNLGLAYASEHDWPAALDADRRSIALDGQFIEPRQNLAAALVHLGHADLAITELRAALAIRNDPFTRELLERAIELNKQGDNPPSQ